MKTKPIPAIVMLIAGFVTCIISIYTHMELQVFTKTLLTVLIVFYILGTVIKIVLDRNFKEMKEENVEEEAEEEQPEKEDGEEEPSEENKEEENLDV
ncbi:MAG: hypothetical protein ACI4C5_08935 [Lachnospiraceae bacterium]